MTLPEIGKLVRQELKRRKKSQRWLAKELGVNHNTIGAIVNGRNKAGKTLYDKVAKLLEINFEMSFPIKERNKKKG